MCAFKKAMLRQQQNANRAATILGQQEQNTKAAAGKRADKNWAQKWCQNNSLYSDQSCKNNFKSNVNSCPFII